jgi:hypothetical protein
MKSRLPVEMTSFAADWRRLFDCARVTLELYRRRASIEASSGSTVLWRAFDKAVRTKPPVVAADAGPMQIQLREGEVSSCARAVR